MAPIPDLFSLGDIGSTLANGASEAMTGVAADALKHVPQDGLMEAAGTGGDIVAGGFLVTLLGSTLLLLIQALVFNQYTFYFPQLSAYYNLADLTHGGEYEHGIPVYYHPEGKKSGPIMPPPKGPPISLDPPVQTEDVELPDSLTGDGDDDDDNDNNDENDEDDTPEAFGSIRLSLMPPWTRDLIPDAAAQAISQMSEEDMERVGVDQDEEAIKDFEDAIAEFEAMQRSSE